MNKLPIFMAISFTFAFLSPVNCDKKLNGTKESLEVPPAIASEPVNPASTKLDDKKLTKLENGVKSECQQTDYRSYVECLLGESKREKRQGYPQQQCSGVSCNGIPTVIQPQSCTGNGCLPANHQQQCIGNGCSSRLQQTSQQPCSAPNGCIFLRYNCGGIGCTQIGQNCYGVGCVPRCNETPCGDTTVVPPNKGDTEIHREINEIRKELEYVRGQNENLLRSTERATSFILQLLNRRTPTTETKIVREPILVGHNSTTNIDINNYLNTNNVVNVPDVKNDVVKENKTHCCVVVRPKTCHRILKPPHFYCGHRRHRTCGTHCSKNQVVYSHVRSGCTGKNLGDENCVTYSPVDPYNPSHSGYSTSGYYPPSPMYYPTFGAQYYPIYAPPAPMPIYAPSPTYLTDDIEELEDCDDCEDEIETEDCRNTDVGCGRPMPKKSRDLAERNDSSKQFNGRDHKALRSSKNIFMTEILRLKKELDEIEQSEDRLIASVDMLEKAMKLAKGKAQKEILGGSRAESIAESTPKP